MLTPSGILKKKEFQDKIKELKLQGNLKFFDEEFKPEYTAGGDFIKTSTKRMADFYFQVANYFLNLAVNSGVKEIVEPINNILEHLDSMDDTDYVISSVMALDEIFESTPIFKYLSTLKQFKEIDSMMPSSSHFFVEKFDESSGKFSMVRFDEVSQDFDSTDAFSAPVISDIVRMSTSQYDVVYIPSHTFEGVLYLYINILLSDTKNTLDFLKKNDSIAESIKSFKKDFLSKSEASSTYSTKGELSSLDSKVTSISNKTSSLESDLTTVKNNIGSLDNKYAKTSDLDSIKTKVTELETNKVTKASIQEVSDKVNTVKKSVDAIPNVYMTKTDAINKFITNETFNPSTVKALEDDFNSFKPTVLTKEDAKKTYQPKDNYVTNLELTTKMDAVTSNINRAMQDASAALTSASIVDSLAKTNKSDIGSVRTKVNKLDSDKLNISEFDRIKKLFASEFLDESFNPTTENKAAYYNFDFNYFFRSFSDLIDRYIKYILINSFNSNDQKMINLYNEISNMYIDYTYINFLNELNVDDLNARQLLSFNLGIKVFLSIITKSKMMILNSDYSVSIVESSTIFGSTTLTTGNNNLTQDNLDFIAKFLKSPNLIHKVKSIIIDSKDDMQYYLLTGYKGFAYRGDKHLCEILLDLEEKIKNNSNDDIKNRMKNLPYLYSSNKTRILGSELKALILRYAGLNKIKSDNLPEDISVPTNDIMLKVKKSTKANLFRTISPQLYIYKGESSDIKYDESSLSNYLELVDTTADNTWTSTLMNDNNIYYITDYQKILSSIDGQISKKLESASQDTQELAEFLTADITTTTEKLNKRIGDLQAENAALMSKLDDITTKYNAAINNNKDLQETVNKLVAEVNAIKRNVIFNTDTSDKLFTNRSRDYSMNYYPGKIKVDTDPNVVIPTDMFVDEKAAKEVNGKIAIANKSLPGTTSAYRRLDDINNEIKKY